MRIIHCCTGGEQNAAEAAEPMAEDQPQPSASESTPDIQPIGAEQQDESEAQDSFQLGFSLGGDAPAAAQLPTFGSDSATEGFGITLDTEASPMDDDSTSHHAPVTDAGLVLETESLAAASVAPEASSTESPHVPEDTESSHMEAELIDALGASQGLPSALAAEDSFTADAQGTGLSSSPFPASGQSAFANKAFDGGNGYDDLFKESPYYNPVWDSGASPEQPSWSQTPFPGTSPSQIADDAGNRSKLQVRDRAQNGCHSVSVSVFGVPG